MGPRVHIRMLLFVSIFVGTVAFGFVLSGEDSIRDSLPGRPVKVATIAIGRTGNRDKSQHDKKLALALEHLETAGQQGVDIACLPEEFAGTTPETIPGPTTEAVAQLAKKYRMYVVCPMCEQSADGRQYNTAVLLDRAGQVQGRYREVFIWWGEGLNPSRESVPVFDTDFGRIAILDCFDTNFDEVWQQAERNGAEMVVWAGGYGGGLPLSGYAMIHNYYVVSAGWGNMIDILGKTIDAVATPRPQQFIATLDLDRTLVHKDFNQEKVARLLLEHPSEIAQEQPLDMEGWYLLHSLKPDILVRDLCKQYEIETLREYRHRSREQINDARVKDKKI
jgi:beta-ureidopropionase